MGFSLVSLLDGADCTHSTHMGYYGLILWILLVIYLFIGLYILCEHYFVPILLNLGKKLNMSDDVIGATLMAAGSSTPELFTALIGIMLYPLENPGPSTNCASAAFNMCIIIGCSIFFSGYQHLQLREYPFIRDCSFYALSILELYLFYEVITPGIIEWYESLTLIMTWIIYTFVLIYNDTILRCLVRVLGSIGVRNSEQMLYSQLQINSNTNSMLNSSSISISETIKLINDSSEFDDEGCDIVDALSSNDDKLCVYDTYQYNNVSIVHPLSAMDNITIGDGFHSGQSGKKEMKMIDMDSISMELNSTEIINDTIVEKRSEVIPMEISSDDQFTKFEKKDKFLNVFERKPKIFKNQYRFLPKDNHKKIEIKLKNITNIDDDEDEDIVQKTNINDVQMIAGLFTLHRNRTCVQYIWYIICMPFRLLFIKSIAHTDVNSNTCRLICALVICICWLGFLTFLCVDASEKIGNCMGLNADVMGLTLLAIGSSMPDCFSSVFAAKQGKGGMAVSNALGSNVFDICICVGFSFFLKSSVNGFQSIGVEGGYGFEFFIIALFVLLAIFIGLMYWSRLLLGKRQGVILVVCYVVFLAVFCYVLQVD